MTKPAVVWENEHRILSTSGKWYNLHSASDKRKDNIIKGKDDMTVKEQLRQFIEDITEDQAVELLQLIDENFELVMSEEDKKAIERGMREIENGEYEPFQGT